MSPDGRTIAFINGAGDYSIWIRRMDSLEAVKLAGTEGSGDLFWSPDSKSIGYRTLGGGLKRIDVAGGSPQALCNIKPGAGGGATWNAEGVIVFGSDNVLYRVSQEGSEPVQVTSLEKSRQEYMHTWPSFLPDGRHFLYSVGRGGQANSPTDLWIGSLDSKETRELLKGVDGAQFVDPGWVLYFQNGAFFRRAFGAKTRSFKGEPVRTGENPGGVGAVGGGVLAYRSGAGQVQRELVWFDRKGIRIGQAGRPAAYVNVEVSPHDDLRLAVDIIDESGHRRIAMIDKRQVVTPFSFDANSDQRPVWSPAGDRIIFQSIGGIYVTSANGAGKKELLFPAQSQGAVGAVPYSFTPDRHFLLYSAIFRAGAVSNLWILPMDGDRKPQLLIRSSHWDTPGLTAPPNSGEGHAQFSPDGKWIAYASNESGQYEVYVESFPKGVREKISLNGGMQPRWSREGKELFFIAADGKLMAARIETSGGKLQPEAATALFQTDLKATSLIVGTSRQYDVSRDGQRFIVNTPVASSATTPITVVLNWTAAFKK